MILVAQGIIFAVLLFLRYRQKGNQSDLILVFFLLIMAWHRTTYTIGFMGWYDTFKNTKVNYYLISLGLAMGPLMYLYVRTIVQAPYKLVKKDYLHFIPVGLFVTYRLVILFHDAMQPGWASGYSGVWQREFHEVYGGPFMHILHYTSQTLYIAFTIQLFLQYRTKIVAFFSSTYRVELNWIRNFLVVYTFLFVYAECTTLIDSFITDLDYVHHWWIHFFSAIAIVYLGIKAYLTDIDKLHGLTFELDTESVTHSRDSQSSYKQEKVLISQVILDQKLHLNPDLTLKDLSIATNMTHHKLSEVVNAAFGKNFKEMINGFRVNEVKQRLIHPDYSHLSLVAIAYDCGFNSKATFNRVFKRQTGLSPTQYKAQSLK